MSRSDIQNAALRANVQTLTLLAYQWSVEVNESRTSYRRPMRGYTFVGYVFLNTPGGHTKWASDSFEALCAAMAAYVRSEARRSVDHNARLGPPMTWDDPHLPCEERADYEVTEDGTVYDTDDGKEVDL